MTANSDQFATSRKIDALPSEALQAFAETLVDRVTGIVGGYQVRVEGAQDELNKALTDIRYQVALGNTAREANATQVGGFLQRLLKEQEAVSAGQTALADRFSTLAESVSDLGLRMNASEDDRRQMNRRIASLEREMSDLRTQLAQRPTPEQAKATYTAMRWLVKQAGGDPDALELP